MIVNAASRIIIDNSRAMLQIGASLTYDSRGVIDNCNELIEQATVIIFVSKTSLPFDCIT
jgi:hypothetical protein